MCQVEISKEKKTRDHYKNKKSYKERQRSHSEIKIKLKKCSRSMIYDGIMTFYRMCSMAF